MGKNCTEYKQFGHFWHLGCFCIILATITAGRCCEKATPGEMGKKPLRSSMKRSVEAKLNHFLGGVPIRLHFRNDLHLARKTWHMVIGLFIAFLYLGGVPQDTGVIILSFFLGLDLLIESTRLRSSAFNHKVVRFWGPFMRNHELGQMSTIPHYLASVILAIAIFPKPVAVLSILYLACGDPIASLTGILYGHKGPRFADGKTMIGTLGGVVTCAFVTFIFLKGLSMSNDTVLGLSLVGGLAGGMAELLPFDVDDNFTIPVISGFVMWLAFMVAGV